MTVQELFPSDAPPEDRLPPQDIHAEQSVLGGMLLSKDAIADCLEVTRSQDFYRPAHELIYDAVLELYGRGEPADAITVADELTKRGQLPRIGGQAYLHQLIAAVPTAANAGYYAQIVAERAVLRRLVEAGTRIVQMGYAQGGAVEDIVNAAQAEVYGVVDTRSGDDYLRLSELLEPTMDEIEVASGKSGQMTGVPTGFTDLDALALEEGVRVAYVRSPAELEGADAIVLPGTKNTVQDLLWLHRSGMAAAIKERAGKVPILGICGGYQMLCAEIDDEVESGAGVVAGLAALPLRVVFGAEKVLGCPSAVWRGQAVSGYEIHHGVVAADGAFPGGTCRGTVWGTMWHGILESDGFRRTFLSGVAAAAGSRWVPDQSVTGFADRREAMVELLADAVREELAKLA